MLRLTKVTDYGFVLLIAMTRRGEALCNAPDLAEATGLPAPMVSKILKSLARGGILDSQRGANGGFRLARAAALVTAGEIIEALEGPVMLTECLDDLPDTCSYEMRCPLKKTWRRINGAILNALAGITLAEMADTAGCCKGHAAAELIHAQR